VYGTSATVGEEETLGGVVCVEDCDMPIESDDVGDSVGVDVSVLDGI